MITDIHVDDINAVQPERLTMQLKEHQLKMLHKCITLETTDININGNEVLTTKCGIIGDRVGSGKSFVVLGLIANNLLVRKQETCMKSTGSSMLSCIATIDHNMVLERGSNIIVVPNNIFNQWKEYIITYTDFNVKYISRKAHIDPYDYYDMEIILVSSTMYTEFARNIISNNLCFSRLIFDEADSINIAACSNINCNFYWFVSSSIDSLLNPRSTTKYVEAYYKFPECHPNAGHGYYYQRKVKSTIGIHKTGFIMNTFKSLYNSNYRKYIFMKCSDELVTNSMSLIEPITTEIQCKNTRILNVLKGIVSQSIQQMICAGDISGAIRELSIEETDETNIVKIVANNLYTELSNKQIKLEMKERITYRTAKLRREALAKIQTEIATLEAKINNIKERIESSNTDPITLEDIENPVIVKCCGQMFDFISITSWITSRNIAKCPMCRAIITTDSLISINNDITEEGVEESKNEANNDETVFVSTENDKNDNLEYLLNNSIALDAKILIFSEYDESFAYIEDMLNKRNTKFRQIRGHPTTIKRTVDEYKNKDLDVLYLNASYYGAGLNLENTTDIIIYHKMNSDLEHQVIGRAQRIGRTNQLHIWKLLYSTE
jgi:hypothetical protein